MVSEPNFHITIFFTENLLAIEIKKTQMKIILELSKILMHEFWYDYVKPKYGKMWVSLWTYKHDIYKDIVDIETRFGASNYELERPLPKEKNKKVIRLMKDELCGRIMTKFVEL